MILIKLITFFLIVKTTTAVDMNGKDENNHMCFVYNNVENPDGTSYTEIEERCCEGYIQVSGEKCVPSCLDCIYGFCATPNNCQCNEGYQMVNGLCKPICNPKCVNGFCNKPGKCGCYNGYKLDHKNSSNCLPKCDKECSMFATCIKPNTCRCNMGYKENKLNAELCEPHCPGMPKNAKCREPFSWDCNDNFRHDLKINKCILNSCACNEHGGYCLDHENQCECYEGFKKNSTTGECEFFCEPPCENSTCVANNVCHCSDGYHKTSKDHICEKNGECYSQTCKNGECSSTGECICKDGFMKSLTYDLQVECAPAEIFFGKVIIMVLGIPILLAIGIILIFYIIARRRTYIINEQPDRELQLLSDMH